MLFADRSSCRGVAEGRGGEPLTEQKRHRMMAAGFGVLRGLTVFPVFSFVFALPCLSRLFYYFWKGRKQGKKKNNPEIWDGK